MKSRARLLAGLAILSAATIGDAQAQRCPPGNNDQCDQWHFEQAELELASVVASALDQIDRFANAETRQEAKDQLREAQQSWSQTRAADCRSASAFSWKRSARTREGYTAACLTHLTRARVAELKRRYLLPD